MDPWNDVHDKAAVFDELAVVVKALANGRRLELVDLLAQGQQSVEELARRCGMAVTTTSSHLQTLKRAGLVRTRRQGSSIFYRLSGTDVAEVYLAAKRTGLRRSASLRDSVGAYLEAADGEEPTPVTDPAAVTSTMTVLDVRPIDEFASGHFPGAVSIPMSELSQRWRELPDGAEVVVYCRGALCRMSREAARWLINQGVDATAMAEGIVEWRAADGVDLEIA